VLGDAVLGDAVTAPESVCVTHCVSKGKGVGGMQQAAQPGRESWPLVWPSSSPLDASRYGCVGGTIVRSIDSRHVAMDISSNMGLVYRDVVVKSQSPYLFAIGYPQVC
jgi:hypothetical protein